MIRHYARAYIQPRLEYKTTQLWENMVSPLCGILSHLYLYHRQTYDPKGIAIGGELTNVSEYRGIKGTINYHIGGMGMTREDAMIKCLAESYERYLPVMTDPEKMRCAYNSYEEIAAQFPDDLLLAPSIFHYFSEEQYAQKNFFSPFNVKSPMLWVKVPEMMSAHLAMWIPAHLIFFGYVPKKERGEQRINSAVSTGTAVHTHLTACLLNSILEMTMIDTAIAHWYTNQNAYRIEINQRTRFIKKIIAKSIPHQNIEIGFYWLPSLDFATFSVACVATSDTIPKLSVGLGSDASLEGAMYKAFIEYIGTRYLSHTLAVLQEKHVNPEVIQNLDDNVLYYALGHGTERVRMKFNPSRSIKDSEIPADIIGNASDVINILLKSFANTGKHLAYIDFTNPESQQLGLVATKLWSPQLLTVPVPYAVPVKHTRFAVYGGVQHLDPHPYP